MFSYQLSLLPSLRCWQIQEKSVFWELKEVFTGKHWKYHWGNAWSVQAHSWTRLWTSTYTITVQIAGLEDSSCTCFHSFLGLSVGHSDGAIHHLDPHVLLLDDTPSTVIRELHQLLLLRSKRKELHELQPSDFNGHISLSHYSTNNNLLFLCKLLELWEVSAGFLATSGVARFLLTLVAFSDLLGWLFFLFTLENSASSHKMEDDDLLPRDVECSWWLPLEPSLARAVLPGRVRSRCLAGSAVLHRCRRPGQALCWCTDTLPGAGPAATLGSQAGGLLRQHCWYPLDGAESGGARAWDTHRCGYQHTCHILQGKVRKTLSVWCCHEDPCHQQDHADPSAFPTISQQHSSHTHHARLHVTLDDFPDLADALNKKCQRLSRNPADFLQAWSVCRSA